MSAPTTLIEALEWALTKNRGGEHFAAAEQILVQAKADRAASVHPDGLTRHQRRIVEEIATVCNTMSRVSNVGGMFAPTLNPIDVLYTAQLGFVRAGALADSLIDWAVVGSADAWLEVQP